MGNTPAPYGPGFLSIDGFIDRITLHHQLWTVVGLRLLEVFAVVLIGYGVTLLAKGLARDPGEAFVLAAMNPLVLLTLIGGAHNDALMTGFLVVGLALAVQRRPVWALFFVAIATSIKAPAAIGLAFVAWNWYGPEATLKQRIRCFAIGGLVTGAVLGVTTLLAGFGFGWVNNLLTNGTVRSWAAPATGVGMALTNTFHAVGLHGVSLGSVLSVTRFFGLLTAVALTLWLLWRSGERGWVHSLGVALILFVELGPVVQPWYLAWGLVVLAAATGAASTSGCCCFDHRALHRPAGRTPAAERPGALQPLVDRDRRGHPRRRPCAAARALDPVVVAREGAREGRLATSVGHHVLVLDDVQPAPVLASDLDLGPHQGEPALLMEPDRAGVLAHDARDQRVEARLLGRGDQGASTRARPPRARGPAGARRPSSRRSWRRPASSRKGDTDAKPRTRSRSGPALAEVVLLVDRHQAGVRGPVGQDPGALLLEGSGHQVEGDLGLDDLGIDNVHQGFGVVQFHQARPHRGPGYPRGVGSNGSRGGTLSPRGFFRPPS